MKFSLQYSQLAINNLPPASFLSSFLPHCFVHPEKLSSKKASLQPPWLSKLFKVQSISHVDPAGMSSLSYELVSMIASHLESNGLFNLRLSCRYLRECSLRQFIQRLFHTRIHLLTQHSLKTLLEISRHPFFCPSVRTLGISRRTITCPHPSVRSKWQNFEELDFHPNSGLITVYLTQVQVYAVGCRAVMLEDKRTSPGEIPPSLRRQIMQQPFLTSRRMILPMKTSSILGSSDASSLPLRRAMP